MAILSVGFADQVARDQFGRQIPVQTVPPDPSMIPVDVAIVADPGAKTLDFFPKRAKWLRLQCDVRCRFWVDIDTAAAPLAFSASIVGYPMEAGQTEMFGLAEDIPAETLKLIVKLD